MLDGMLHLHRIGPVFVEGNEFPGHDIYQLPLHVPEKIGMMPKFDFSKK